MKPEAELPLAQVPPLVQRLDALPSLVIADATDDVRGWEVRSEDGRLLGRVSDLLVDPDRLTAEFLAITPAGPGDADVSVPLSSLEPRSGYLVRGRGMRSIGLRYRSTTRLTLWTVLAVVVLLVGWIIGTLAC